MAAKRLVIVLFALTTGCSTAPSFPPVQIPERESTSPSETPTTERQPTAARTADTGGATLALLRQSERANRAGEHQEAVGYIERAIRLNPLQADLWTELASLHLQNDDLENALRFANKAVSLAGRRADWLRDAWLLIADAKAQQGNKAEARAIRKRWRSYRG
ncbi:MAG: tetratricopeptide repeat protein [Gammaproteobacteria bacterium]|nr:tetratricopeptide repeat protein [Gammaproteobacteria bacterium]